MDVGLDEDLPEPLAPSIDYPAGSNDRSILGTSGKRWLLPAVLCASVCTAWAGATDREEGRGLVGIPTPSSLTAGRVVFAGTSGILDDDSVFVWDDTNKYVGIGPAAPLARLHVTRTLTATNSIVAPLIYGQHTRDPASASATTPYGARLELSTLSGNTQNFTGSSAGIRAQNEHLGDGTMSGDLQGAHFIGSVGGAATTTSGTGLVSGVVYGVLAAARADNSITAGNVVAASAYGLYSRVTNHTAGTITTGVGGQSVVESTAGVITNAYGHRIAHVLSGGTLTNSIGLDVGDWSSGPTYTNAPIGINIESQTASGAIALRTGTGKISLGDKVTTYDGIPTVGKGIPSIVAEATNTAQSTAVGSTKLYTPPADGWYRVSVVLKVTTPATTSSTLGGATITFTDAWDSVAQTQAMGLVGGSGVLATSSADNTRTTRLSGTSVFYAKKDVAIKYSLSYASKGATAMQYAYNVILEAL